MDVQAYISSGILEQYVAGELSLEQMLEVDALARQHPDIANELEAIRVAISEYAGSQGLAPSAQVWQAIEQQINTPAAIAPQAKVISLRWKVFAVAASLLLLISFGLNVQYYTQLNSANKKLALLESEQSVLADQVKQLTADQDYNQSLIAALSDPGTTDITLTSVTDNSSLTAQVYWNKAQSAVYILPQGLPEPPAGKQYQLWALVDGQPVDAGLIDGVNLQAMKSIGQADAFAITLEPVGGSAVPTLDLLQAVGSVNG